MASNEQVHRFVSHVDGLQAPFLGDPAECGYHRRTVTVAVLTRQRVELPDRTWATIVTGEEAEPDDFAQDFGEVAEGRAWWEVPLPPCPDCGGVLVWAEGGFVPGTRRCPSCGSLFSVRCEERETDTCVDNRGNTGTLRSEPLDVARADHRALLVAAYSPDEAIDDDDLDDFRKWLTEAMGLNHWQVAEVVEGLN